MNPFNLTYTEFIETHRLTKYYGKHRGVIDLDLSIGEGEYFGFIGPNGAGKSTTIRTLLGLIKPTSASVKVLGEDATKDKTNYLKDVGYMLSEAMFYGNMKVKDIIAFSAYLRKMNCRDNAKEICEKLQLDTNKKIEAILSS